MLKGNYTTERQLVKRKERERKNKKVNANASYTEMTFQYVNNTKK